MRQCSIKAATAKNLRNKRILSMEFPAIIQNSLNDKEYSHHIIPKLDYWCWIVFYYSWTIYECIVQHIQQAIMKWKPLATNCNKKGGYLMINVLKNLPILKPENFC